MKKILLGLVVLSSLQFAQEEEKLETNFNFDSKLDVLQYLHKTDTSNNKNEDKVEIVYATGKFELPTLKLEIGYNASQKADKFENIDINYLNASSYLKYETPSYKDKLSAFLKGEILIGPKENEGDFYFELGGKYNILDNLVYKQSLKYYSNKLKTPKKLTTITEFNYNNEELDLKFDSLNEIGGNLYKLVNTDKIKTVGNSFVYDFDEKIKYQNYNFDLKINGELSKYIQKESVVEEKEESKEESKEENKLTTDEVVDSNENKEDGNTTVTSEEKENVRVKKTNKVEISLNTKFKNIYKNLFIEPKFKYAKDISVYTDSTKKPEEIAKLNYNLDSVDTSFKVGYDFYINNIVSVTPYSTLEYSYKTNTYNQVQWLAGTSVYVNPIDNIKLEFDVKTPIAFTFDKVKETVKTENAETPENNDNKETVTSEEAESAVKESIKFRYKKVGIGVAAKFSYFW